METLFISLYSIHVHTHIQLNSHGTYVHIYIRNTCARANKCLPRLHTYIPSTHVGVGVYVYMYMCTCTHPCFSRTCLYIIYSWLCLCTHIYIHTCVCILIHVPYMQMHVCTCVVVYVCMYVCMYVTYVTNVM